MTYLKLNGEPLKGTVVEEGEGSPFERLDAIVTSLVERTLIPHLHHDHGDEDEIRLMFMGFESLYGANLCEEEGQDEDLTWIPTLVEAVKTGSDEPVREAVFCAAVGEAEFALYAWNASGDAICGRLKGFVPGIAAFDAHGHMPKHEEEPELLAVIEGIGHYLWGPAWSLTVPEEDRC